MSTYVLIHGSWHGAWCWYKITARLKAAGHTVIVPDMPGHGREWTPPGQATMQDFVNTITEAVDSAAEPVVLVVHSRNGITVAQAAEARPEKIRTPVFLAAYLPPVGDTTSLAQSKGGWADNKEALSLNHTDVNRDAGSDMLQRHLFREVLYADCPDEDAELADALFTKDEIHRDDRASQLLARSDLERSYTYEYCQPAPVPMRRNYQETIRVNPIVETLEEQGTGAQAQRCLIASFVPCFLGPVLRVR